LFNAFQKSQKVLLKSNESNNNNSQSTTNVKAADDDKAITNPLLLHSHLVELPLMSHNNLYLHRQWLVEMLAFLEKVEKKK
jgi:hypothetical protein